MEWPYTTYNNKNKDPSENKLSKVKSTLDVFERRLQSIIEGGFISYASDQRQYLEITDKLLKILEESASVDKDKTWNAGNQFIIITPTDLAIRIEMQPALLEYWTHCIDQAGREADLQFSGPISIRVEADPALQGNSVKVIARSNLQEISSTTGLQLEEAEKNKEFAGNAYLVVNGTQLFELSRAVTNIGRRTDNDLVLDHPGVSRIHAQLRCIRGRFIIIDLDSKGGTWVNGIRVNQQLLFPGDVITLAGVPLIFGQEDLPLEETQGYSIS